MHTGLWPHEKVDFSRNRVGVIGTGSSAMQSIPIIAREAAEVFVFQRTAHYAVPAHNGPIDPERVREVKANYPQIRQRAKRSATGFDQTFNDKAALEVSEEEREREFEERWAYGGLPFLSAFTDLRYSEEANQTAGEFVRNKIREIVKDPKTAELLCPTTVIGCKRLCVITEYFEIYNRPNVHLIDVSESPIEKITPEGVMTGGRVYEIDTLILATGYDAMTGTLLRIDIRGRGGRTLQDKWKAGPRTYLGLMTAGFRICSPSRTRKPLGADEHADFHRPSRRVDRRLSRVFARKRLEVHRGDPGGGGRLGGAQQRGGCQDDSLPLHLLVSGSEHTGQAARVHALHLRVRRVFEKMRGNHGGGIRGFSSDS